MCNQKEINFARKTPKQARSRKMVGWILDAATRVFEEYGYAGATTNHIADKAGVSIGSLYQYFPNKESLLTTVAMQHLEEGKGVAEKLLADVMDAPPRLDVLLKVFIQEFIAQHEQNPRLHRLLFEEAPLPEIVWQAYRDFIEDAIAKVSFLLEKQPEVKVQNTAMAAYMLVHTLESMAHQLVIHPPEGISVEEGMAGFVDLFMAYLTKLPA